VKIKITESQAKRFTDLLKESSMDNITVKKTDDGSIVFNDKIRYNLEVKKLGMWNEVDITDIAKIGPTYKITASLGGIVKTDVLDPESMEKIKTDLGRPVIEFITKELPKRLVRVPLGDIAGL